MHVPGQHAPYIHSTTFAGSVAEHLQADTEDASLLIRPATLSRFKRDFAAAYKSADLLTYLHKGNSENSLELIKEIMTSQELD